jgi:hypothetical protein
MKLLENKPTSIVKTEGVFINYADLLVVLINKPLQKTTTIKEMRRDMKLIDELEDAKEVIELTDDNYTYLLGLVQNSEWAIKHKDILTFADDFEDAAKGVEIAKA